VIYAGKTFVWHVDHVFTNLGTLSSVDCSTAKSCLAVGSGDAGAVTANKGVTWGVVQISASSTGLLNISCPLGSTACEAVGSVGIYGTLDQGSQWTNQLHLAAGTTLAGVSCYAADSCVTVGTEAGIGDLTLTL
jgi:hypothetical protein